MTDAALVERLTQEAASMFDALIGRLEQYKDAQGTHALTPLHSYSLQGTPDCVTRLGISSPDRLNQFMAMNGHSSPRSTDPPANPLMTGTVAPIGTPKAQQTKSTETVQVSTMPKFTWAAASKPAESAQKPSLLDIQKEELKSKD